MALLRIYVLLTSLSQLCFGSALTHIPRQSSLQPVLTTLANTPDLSTFYSLFNATGGESGIPAPAFEERFNDNRDKRRWTILAPTNDAFASLSPGFIATLTAPPAYELLATLLRNHILQGNFSYNDLFASSSGSIVTVGGFTVSIGSGGDIFTNDGLTPSAKVWGPQAQLDLEGGSFIPASNGGVYRIDNVLDFFATYFGVDAGSKALPATKSWPGITTMGEVLSEDSRLSTLRSTLEEVEPELLERLALASEEDDENKKTVYLAPSNAAFDVLPDAADSKVVQPSNDGATSYFLSFGLGTYNEGSKAVMSNAGFDIAMDGGMANNAKVEDRICTENGCVWIVGRWLDAFYGQFDI